MILIILILKTSKYKKCLTNWWTTDPQPECCICKL